GVIDPTRAGKYPVVLSDALLGGPGKNVFTDMRCTFIPSLQGPLAYPSANPLPFRQPQARALLGDEPRASPPETRGPGLDLLLRALLPGRRRKVRLRGDAHRRRQP